MSEELRKAAERVLCTPHQSDAIKCATYVLATVQPDDAERKPPRPRVVATLELGADSILEAARKLRDLGNQLAAGELGPRCVSGGFTWAMDVDESITAESYAAALEHWSTARGATP